MNFSELSHQQFKDLMKDKSYIESVKKGSKNWVSNFEEALAKDLIGDPLEAEFLNLLLIEGRSNYYLLFIESEKTFILIKRNLKGVMLIGHNKPIDKFAVYYNNVPKVIEITQIHSFKKGEGRKMLKTLMKLSKDLKLDLALWTETKKNTQYFEGYGFESFGNLGKMQENLMIYRSK